MMVNTRFKSDFVGAIRKARTMTLPGDKDTLTVLAARISDAGLREDAERAIQDGDADEANRILRVANVIA